MARRTLIEEPEYELSSSSSNTFEWWWPDRMTPTDRRFEEEMARLQIELITNHFKMTMTTREQTRALRTLKYLRRKLAGEECYW
jgi:hypothetical protein